MKPVSPNLGGEEHIVSGGDVYFALPAMPTQGIGDDFLSWLCRWTFTPEERQRIAAGEDVTVTFPHKVAPHSLRLVQDVLPEPERPDAK